MSRQSTPQEDLDRETLARLRDAIRLLEEVVRDRGLLAPLSAEERTRLIRAAGDIFNPDTAARRHLVKATRKQRRAADLRRDEDVLHETGIRSLRRQTVFTTPNVFAPASFDPADVAPDRETAGEATSPRTSHVDERHCYICKAQYAQLHHFYDQLCPACAAFNFHKRTELADLRGRVAIVTGARVKIGYQAGLKLLRSGVSLIVTTRFPRDAALRYAAEPDFEQWRDRLEVFGLDLRHTPSVEAFCRHVLATRDRLDFIVNNACQTVRRPPAFYAHMMDAEAAAAETLAPAVRALLGSYGETDGLPAAAGLSQVPLLPEDLGDAPGLKTRGSIGTAGTPGLKTRGSSELTRGSKERTQGSTLFPEGQLDQDLQQIDLRDRNSWRLLLSEVSTVELLEVHLVNAIAPFIFNARLKPLMLRTPGRDKHIVNVSAVEGQFYRRFKTTRHPHTNMAKAALNMMTRTSATDYHADGIHMNSVDTGWVTDEDPVHIAARKTAEHRFHPPLDIVDGAARIVDPIISGVKTGSHVWGQFLKDYRPIDW
jgi:NAD(P)-dependent dehydrogenase (short-subunit alcohol dehydrogenase family)